ncbi:amino acid ABC transporter permease [Martelella sp. HB161492]|uniref:amino acid ABC transporter permease n=1 Tax=Martelella sp. HB161492 TaxID=2720726 RepID=UPI0015925C0E|nr:amino acid ABC transporter permease [Martelella sp. HB161492]
MQYHWDFHSVWQYRDLFIFGLWTSIVYTVGSIILGIAIGLLTCSARLSTWKMLNWIARIYQEIFRCTPLLVQLLWFYYAFPLIVGISIDNRVAATLALSLYVGAFYAEIFRGGIVSIEKGQREAAAAIGMSPAQAMWRIIMPQALKRMLPSFINQSVIQFKNTSLVSVISVADLAYMAAVVNGQTYRPLESYTVMAVLYIVVLLPMMQAADWLEKRMRKSD